MRSRVRLCRRRMCTALYGGAYCRLTLKHRPVLGMNLEQLVNKVMRSFSHVCLRTKQRVESEICIELYGPERNYASD